MYGLLSLSLSLAQTDAILTLRMMRGASDGERASRTKGHASATYFAVGTRPSSSMAL